MTIRDFCLLRPAFFIFLMWIIFFYSAQNTIVQAQPAIHWVASTQAETWQELPATIQSQTQVTESNVVRLDPATTYQTTDSGK
jgi:hypothetical protein